MKNLIITSPQILTMGVADQSGNDMQGFFSVANSVTVLSLSCALSSKKGKCSHTDSSIGLLELSIDLKI